MSNPDLVEITSDTVRNELTNVIEELLGTSSFQVSLEPGSEQGANLVGIVYRCLIHRTDINEFHVQNSGTKKQLSKLFLKVVRP